MEQRPLVKNASDPEQVKAAENKHRSGRVTELDDFKVVLSTPQGRRLLWRLMGKAKVFETVWESSARIHYNAGQQDFGHFIMSEILEADEESYFKMMREAKQQRY